MLNAIGGTQSSFWDLPKFSNIGKIFRLSCSASKIVPSYKIWVHWIVLEPRNRIIMDVLKSENELNWPKKWPSGGESPMLFNRKPKKWLITIPLVLILMLMKMVTTFTSIEIRPKVQSRILMRMKSEKIFCWEKNSDFWTNHLAQNWIVPSLLIKLSRQKYDNYDNVVKFS